LLKDKNRLINYAMAQTHGIVAEAFRIFDA